MMSSTTTPTCDSRVERRMKLAHLTGSGPAPRPHVVGVGDRRAGGGEVERPAGVDVDRELVGVPARTCVPAALHRLRLGPVVDPGGVEREHPFLDASAA